MSPTPLHLVRTKLVSVDATSAGQDLSNCLKRLPPNGREAGDIWTWIAKCLDISVSAGAAAAAGAAAGSTENRPGMEDTAQGEARAAANPPAEATAAAMSAGSSTSTSLTATANVSTKKRKLDGEGVGEGEEGTEAAAEVRGALLRTRRLDAALGCTGTGTTSTTTTTGTTTTTTATTTSSSSSSRRSKQDVRTTPPDEASEAASSQMADTTARRIFEQLWSTMKGKHHDRYLSLSLTPQAEEQLSTCMRDARFATELEALRRACKTSKTEHDLEEKVAHFLNQSAEIYRLHSPSAASNITQIPQRSAVVQSRTSVALRLRHNFENAVSSKPENSIKPDISIGDCTTNKRCNWNQILTVVEVKLASGDDGNVEIMGQIAGYARMLFSAHPIARHVHILTWCGPIVRLWRFEANRYAVTRGFSIHHDGDLADILRVVLLCMADQHLLPTWNPPRFSTLKLTHPKGNTQSRQLVLNDAAPAEALVRPAVLGSRTVILIYPSTAVQSISSMTLGGQSRLFDGDKRLFVKASWRPDRLVGHELNMLQLIQDGLIKLREEQNDCWRDVDAPAPLGAMTEDVDWTTWADSSGNKLSLDVLAFVQHKGQPIQQDTSEADLAQVFGQLVRQLAAYAQIGLHYRDLNQGNILMLPGAEGRLARLVLADHGNTRIGTARLRGPDSLCRERNEDEWMELAEDDARSANHLFLPLCALDSASHARAYRNCQQSLPELEAAQRKATMTGSVHKMELASEQLSEAQADFKRAREQIFVRCHRYIDDVESLVYLYLYTVSRRDMPTHDLIKEQLSDGNRKADLWGTGWYKVVTIGLKEKLKVSSCFTDCIDQVRFLVRRAQKKMQSVLEEHFKKHLANDDSAIPELKVDQAELDLFQDVAMAFERVVQEHGKSLERITQTL